MSMPVSVMLRSGTPEVVPVTAPQANATPSLLHTLVLSDLHLSDAQDPLPDNPLWKRYKHRDLFVDEQLSKFIAWVGTVGDGGPVELVFNGDIFDFDAVVALPKNPNANPSWLERRRGVGPEEPKSRFKMRVILDEHPLFVAAVRDLLAAGHRVVFVIGNHDVELHWPGVREELRARLTTGLTLQPDQLRVCEWFFISEGDTLLEHGNQYDSYCLCNNPLNPLIEIGSRPRIRVPFGNLAARYIMNGIGLINPHVTSSWMRSPTEYFQFLVNYVPKVDPWILWTWFWGAFVVSFVALRDGFQPDLVDPMTVERRVEEVASRAHATPAQVRGLMALRVHPATFDPPKILRELWLDRVILLFLLTFGSFQLFAFANVIATFSVLWAFVPFLLLLLPFLLYARSIHSDVDNVERALRKRIPLASRIVGVKRAVLGHTHRAIHQWIGGVEVLNTGTWSPAFHDVECQQPYGSKNFAWIEPFEGSRRAALYEWTPDGARRISAAAPPSSPLKRFVRAGGMPVRWVQGWTIPR